MCSLARFFCKVIFNYINFYLKSFFPLFRTLFIKTFAYVKLSQNKKGALNWQMIIWTCIVIWYNDWRILWTQLHAFLWWTFFVTATAILIKPPPPIFLLYMYISIKVNAKHTKQLKWYVLLLIYMYIYISCLSTGKQTVGTTGICS